MFEDGVLDPNYRYIIWTMVVPLCNNSTFVLVSFSPLFKLYIDFIFIDKIVYNCFYFLKLLFILYVVSESLWAQFVGGKLHLRRWYFSENKGILLKPEVAECTQSNKTAAWSRSKSYRQPLALVMEETLANVGTDLKGLC